MNEKHKTYQENPSIKEAIVNTKKGVKVMFAKNGSQEILVRNEKTEEYEEATIDFTRTIQVDRDEFIKLYIHAFPALANLKNSTKIVYQYVLQMVHEQIGKHEYYLSHADYMKRCATNPALQTLSQPTFSRCLTELLDNEIVYKSDLKNLYFLNIAYAFNGDRLKFINEYIVRKTADAVAASDSTETP